MVPPARESAVFQLVRANHEQAEQGHKRLREDYRDHEDRILKAEAILSEHVFAIKALQTATPDLSRMTLSPGVVVAIVVAVVSIISGQLASTWGLRSDINLQGERAIATRGVVDEIKKKQDLQQLEIQSLRETILNQRRLR